MGLGPSLSIRQSQQLVLTPQLRQAIQLLQLSNLELDAFIAEELSKNPLLESRSEDGDEQSRAATSSLMRAMATKRRTIPGPTTSSWARRRTTGRSTSTGSPRRWRRTAIPTS